MSHQQNLEIVCQACIQANPERFKVPTDLPLPVKYDGINYYWGKNGEMVADFDSGVNQGEGFRIRGWGRIKDEGRQDECAKYIEVAINSYSSVRLADVLLAIGKINPIPEVDLFCTQFEISKHGTSGRDNCLWNLLKDDLRDQSEPTVAFLAGILK